MGHGELMLSEMINDYPDNLSLGHIPVLERLGQKKRLTMKEEAYVEELWSLAHDKVSSEQAPPDPAEIRRLQHNARRRNPR